MTTYADAQADVQSDVQSDSSALVRRRLVVTGVVQGVGFRPHVARTATRHALTGTCRNDATSVVVEVAGPAEALAAFERDLVAEAPPLARVEDVRVEDLGAAPDGRPQDFTIVESTDSEAGPLTMVPPDTAPCDACVAELADPADRRFRHPFIACTHCGPRLTITRDLPYDRPATTMAAFPLCDACATEYADPLDRRFHTQPVCCHDCGPRLRLHDLAADPVEGPVEGTEPVLGAAVAALRAGKVVAVKGVGGYHLACDAGSTEAVARLRERKHRPEQPFAVMARDLATARTLVETNGAEDLLTSPERPIVLLPARADAPVAGGDRGIAPGVDELGVVLPYTPLHHLLLSPLPDGTTGPDVLVMTSGNVSGEPLCTSDAEALTRLSGIADLVLAHDREIAVPCEDSVVAWSTTTGAVPVRRSRGWAPLPVDLGSDATDVVLAAGAEVKNTVALARDGRAFVSSHVGDLASLSAREHQQRVTDQLLGFHRSTPDLVVADRHPGYASRAWARRQADAWGAPVLEVQHHHAHLASLAAEHGRLDQPLLGVVLDGTGYGCDATVWGGELLLLGDGGTRADRLGALGTVRLPGGDAGVRNPARTAALALLDAGVDLDATPVAAALAPAERTLMERAHASGAGWVPTSSTGRLFDVVASLLGVRHRVGYDAQAAVELESVARRAADPAGVLPTPLPVAGADTDLPRLDVRLLLADLAWRLRDGEPVPDLALAFHLGLADGVAGLAAGLAERHDLGAVGLSGGVWVNRVLLTRARARLEAAGLEVLVHRVVPPTDGGLSLGQAAVGAAHLDRERRAVPPTAHSPTPAAPGT
ncbi:MAG: carbamoyltransferase HypF [Nocardioides sp.]|nr:carbamoyltransferase HypF [Nocardioides sp.]